MRHFIDIVEDRDSVTATIMTGDDTVRWLHDDPRARTAAKGLRYLIPQYAHEEIHVHVIDGNGDRRAMGGFQINPRDPEQLWVKFISVRPEFRGLGYARLIYETIYPWAAAHGLKIAPGSFTDDGRRLAHIHDDLATRYPTVAYRRDHRGNYVNDAGSIVRSAD